MCLRARAFGELFTAIEKKIFPRIRPCLQKFQQRKSAPQQQHVRPIFHLN